MPGGVIRTPMGIFFPDFYWEGERLIGEADGREKYEDSEASVREKEREQCLRDLDFRVVRWLGKEIYLHPGRRDGPDRASPGAADAPEAPECDADPVPTAQHAPGAPEYGPNRPSFGLCGRRSRRESLVGGRFGRCGATPGLTLLTAGP